MNIQERKAQLEKEIKRIEKVPSKLDLDNVTMKFSTNKWELSKAELKGLQEGENEIKRLQKELYACNTSHENYFEQGKEEGEKLTIERVREIVKEFETFEIGRVGTNEKIIYTKLLLSKLEEKNA